MFSGNSKYLKEKVSEIMLVFYDSWKNDGEFLCNRNFCFVVLCFGKVIDEIDLINDFKMVKYCWGYLLFIWDWFVSKIILLNIV